MTLDDFIQNYQETFIFLKFGSERVLVIYETSYGNDIIFTSPDIGKISIPLDKVMNLIHCKFPETGLYNIPKHIPMLVYRKPERQYKKAIHRNNTAVISLGLNNVYEINYTLAKHVYKEFYPKTREEAEKLINSTGGVALNKKFGLTVSDIYLYDLYYHNNYIGYIDKNYCVVVSYNPLRQEIVDFFGEDLKWI